MNSSVALIILGLLVCYLVPYLYATIVKPKKKKSKNVNYVCKVIGIVILFLGVYGLITALLSL